MFTLGTETLPNPEIGDVQRFLTHAIFRQTRNGTLKRFQPSITQRIYVYAFKLHDCTREVLEGIIAYVRYSAGLEITWVDHLGVSRSGYVITESPEFISEGKDSYSFTLELLEKVQP